ncbi:MAG: glycosyltransferase [Ruminococcus flavefaciens]|nr:glycosyltransferase [Ruminococcus flavefaciens]
MENYVMNLYRQMDRQQIQFDFIVHHKKKGLYEDEIKAMGGKVYHFSALDDKNIFKYINELNVFFTKHNEYKIIHGHLSSLAFFYFGVAKKHGVQWRIAHSHGAGFLHTPKGFAKYLMFRTTKWNANVRLACSSEAGKYLYGKNSFKVVPNGIDCSRFSYNAQIREQIRSELGLIDNYVIGHIGRFNLQKNHCYLLKIFKSFLKDFPNAKLLLLGEGELWDKIQKQADEMKIADNIIFAGVHKDCEKYYQAMDVFVLPSLFEGLPVTGIEAQYAGLPCLFSDAISKEVEISENVHFLGIDDDNIKDWCNALADIKKNCIEHNCTVKNDMFDSEKAAENMVLLYKKLWRKKPC